MSVSLLKQYQVLVIEPNHDRRSRFMQACSSVAGIKGVVEARSCDLALGKLAGHELVDIVFVSASIDEKVIESFFDQAKKSRQGKDAAFVLMRGASEDSGSLEVARQTLVGFHGVVQEPFSVHDLLAICELASGVKFANEERRKDHAARVIVRDLSSSLDLYCYCLAALGSQEAAQYLIQLRNGSQQLRKLDAHEFQRFVKVFEQHCEKMAKSQPSEERYRGPSRILQRRAAARALEEIRKLHAEE